MPGFMPGIHVLLRIKTWMAGTSPAMTNYNFRCAAFQCFSRLAISAGLKWQ